MTLGKWAVIADLQFDTHDGYSTLLPSGITSRLHDMVVCFNWVASEARKHGCEGIIVNGDIFDSRTVIDVSVLDSVCRAFRAAHKLGLKLIVVAGNHDSYLRSPRINSLQVFQGYCTVVETPTVIGSAGMAMGFVPWTEELDDLRAGVDTVLTRGAKYLFTHVLLRGAVTAGDKGVPLSILKPERFKQVFLGDVHDPKEISETVRYIGSPLQINYGDAGGWRGMLVFDSNDGSVKSIENTISPRFHVITDVTVDGVRKQDFVRVKTDDVEIAVEAEAAAKKVTGWVESTFVERTEVTPRLDIRSSQTHESVLRDYCLHQGMDNDALVDVGLSILEEAKQ